MRNSKLKARGRLDILSKRFKLGGKAAITLTDFQRESLTKFKGEKYDFKIIPCPVCGSFKGKILSERDRYGLYYPCTICKKCGLIRTNPVMTEKSYNHFYNIYYRKIYRNIDIPNEKLFQSGRKRGKLIFNYISKYNETSLKNMKILEVGTAMGGTLDYFKYMGNHVFGVEVDKKCVKFARERGLNIKKGTIKEVPNELKPDIVIYSHVLEHLLNPVKEMKILRKLITDKTMVYVELPGIRNVSYYGRDLMKLLQNAHIYNFTLKTLKNVMSVSGFEIVKGDEYIRSIFRRAKRKGYESDYEESLNFLKRLEFQLPFFRAFSKISKNMGLSHFGRKLFLTNS